jgi:cell volume regulation protein A
MLENFELISFTLAFLVIISVFASKVSVRFGFPSFFIFLVIGMLAGSDGVGKIYFENHKLAQVIGMIALVYILFAGGLETNLNEILPIFKDGFILANLGVVITAFLVGILAYYFLHFSFLEAFLLGSIVASTDAASVFGLLRTTGIGLKGKLKPLLEFESGSNDTAAVILTTTFIQLIQVSEIDSWKIFIYIILQISVGSLFGYFSGKFISYILNKVQLEHEGLYTVLTVTYIYSIYSLTNFLNGNGFLAVYICGILLGNSNFFHKRTIIMFIYGLSWLMQIVMFLTLGLLVYPSRLTEVFLVGILFAFFLTFIARPVSVFICLFGSKYSLKEKLFISWVGLRGATPIILATFPFTVGYKNSEYIFNIIFFIVLCSLLLQGSTIVKSASLLGLTQKQKKGSLYPFDFENKEDSSTKLVEFIVPYFSNVSEKSLVELPIPEGCLITLICRGNEYIIPNGKATLQAGDVLLVLTTSESEKEFSKMLSSLK